MIKRPSLVSSMEKHKVKNICKNYRTDKSYRMFIKMIAEQMQVELMNEIRTARFLLVLSNGSMDSGVLKQVIVYVRFVYNGLTKAKFIDIEHLHK